MIMFICYLRGNKNLSVGCIYRFLVFLKSLCSPIIITFCTFLLVPNKVNHRYFVNLSWEPRKGSMIGPVRVRLSKNNLQ